MIAHHISDEVVVVEQAQMSFRGSQDCSVFRDVFDTCHGGFNETVRFGFGNIIF